MPVVNDKMLSSMRETRSFPIELERSQKPGTKDRLCCIGANLGKRTAAA
jgi:hypothetical protein